MCIRDRSGSNQEFADNSVANFGASNDMTIFHDGTDSLITNKTGAMKIATETSGIAVTIGHTTSETTVADNLTTTGTLTVGSTAITTNGITAASQWRLTTSFTGDADPIASNWEKNDTAGYSSLGSDMTESSGVFTFPSTGYWKIDCNANFYLANADSRSNQVFLKTTINNSAYTQQGDAETNISEADTTYSTWASVFSTFIFDVTSTSNCKCSMQVTVDNDSTTTKGSSTVNNTYITFTRLGDT